MRYEHLRDEWRRRRYEEKENIDMVGGILGYECMSPDLARVVLGAVGRIWKEREKSERLREQ